MDFDTGPLTNEPATPGNEERIQIDLGDIDPIDGNVTDAEYPWEAAPEGEVCVNCKGAAPGAHVGAHLGAAGSMPAPPTPPHNPVPAYGLQRIEQGKAVTWRDVGVFAAGATLLGVAVAIVRAAAGR